MFYSVFLQFNTFCTGINHKAITMSDCGQLFRKVSLDFLWEVMQRQPRDISCGVSIEMIF